MLEICFTDSCFRVLYYANCHCISVLAMLFEAGIILGANSEPVTYPIQSSSADVRWPYLQLERTVRNSCSVKKLDFQWLQEVTHIDLLLFHEKGHPMFIVVFVRCIKQGHHHNGLDCTMCTYCVQSAFTHLGLWRKPYDC